MTPERLDDLLSGFSRARVAVVGDFFLDKYLDVDPALAERSVETGKRAHQVVRVRCSPGAAGTVVSNLTSLRAGVLHVVGILGDDGEGYDLRRGLAQLGCRCDGLVIDAERMTPTYLKPRDRTDQGLGGEHERYDTKNRTPTPSHLQDAVLAHLDGVLDEVDAVVILDQVEELDCGVITARVRDALAERARRYPRVVFWADSRRHIRRFRNVIMKPNQFEAVGRAPGADVDAAALLRALAELRQQAGAPVVITRGAHGMLVSDPEPTWVRGVRVDGPVDPTGAGDSATAGAVLALTAGASLPEAALVGSLVASITVRQLATTGVARPEELPAALALWHEQAP